MLRLTAIKEDVTTGVLLQRRRVDARGGRSRGGRRGVVEVRRRVGRLLLELIGRLALGGS